MHSTDSSDDAMMQSGNTSGTQETTLVLYELPRASNRSNAPRAALGTLTPISALLCRDIERCFAFFLGVLGHHERCLQQLLCQLYSSARSSDGSPATSPQAATELNFCQVHAVASVLDVAKLFPGGPRTWYCVLSAFSVRRPR